MKTLILLIITLISYLGAVLCPVWALVEFILYLVKDKEFNWSSLWLSIISYILIVVMIFINAFYENKKQYENRQQSFIKTHGKNKKSKWQSRLEELQNNKL